VRRAAAVAATLGLVAACSGGGSGSASDTTRPAQTSPTSSTLATTTTTAPTTTTTTPAQAIAAGLCPELPPRARPDPNRPVYVAHANVEGDLGAVTGDLTVTFTPDLPTDVLVFRLWPNAPRTLAAGIRLEPGPVTAAGSGVPLVTAAPDVTTLEVALGRTLGAGEAVTVSMPWTLTVGGSAHDRVGHSGDALRLGGFLPILAWEPGVGWAREPATALFGEASTSPTADYDLALTVPAGYDVLASGERGTDGVWRARAVRDIAVSIGHFVTASSTESLPQTVQVTVGVDRGIGESPAVYLSLVVDALRAYSYRFGPYPWSTFSLTITPGLEGNGIEYPSHVFQGSGTANRVTPHEVAHQWFYGLMGSDQARDPWMDEGMAAYAEFAHTGSLADNEAKSIPTDAKGRAGAPMTYWADHADSYYRGVYVQAALAVAALGTQAWVDCAVRHYAARNAYRISRPDDFFAAMQVIWPDAQARLGIAG
jgi:hypothetical protein